MRLRTPVAVVFSTAIVAMATAPVALAQVDWTYIETVVPPGEPGTWDSYVHRLGNVVFDGTTYHMFLLGGQTWLPWDSAWAVGHWTLNPLTQEWDEDDANPVLSPEPAAPYFEQMASQAAVLHEWDAKEQRWDWFMYYSYRGKDGTLPGLRLATSRDGKTWTRHYNEKDPRGMGQIFKSTPGAYYEWHQVSKIGGTYVLSIEVGISAGKRWRPVIAVSQHPATGWEQIDVDTVLQTKWGGLYRDDTIYHVATPAFYRIEGKWYLYTQACPLPGNGNYIDGQWDMWCFACDRLVPTLPGYESIYIPGRP